MSRYLYLVFGWIFLIFGVIGLMLPLLPTTPFLLLTAFCFSRGSERLHQWLITNKTFGPPLNDWNEKGIIRLKYKVLATTMLTTSAIFIFPSGGIPIWGKIGFTVTMSLVLLFIWTRPHK